MPEHEARLRAFYDYEAEEPRAGRRRRQVADWGVGEDVFDRLPTRRFGRGESAHGRWSAAPVTAESDAPRPAAPVTPSADAPVRSPGAEAQPRPELDAPTRPLRRAAAPPRPRPIPRGGADDGRRTIVIGEPREDHALHAPRRPPRLAHERVGPRPDRIVAYAVGLGVLLILIAILSAGH